MKPVGRIFEPENVENAEGPSHPTKTRVSDSEETLRSKHAENADTKTADWL